MKKKLMEHAFTAWAAVKDGKVITGQLGALRKGNPRLQFTRKEMVANCKCLHDSCHGATPVKVYIKFTVREA